MMYELCSYDIHENDLEMAKNLAIELGLKLKIARSGRLINHGICGLNADKELYYTICFDEIEVESWEDGDNFEDNVFWKSLQERSTDTYLLNLLNS